MDAAAFSETLKNWETFYFSAVAASATLIGLMFVALSLAQSFIATVRPEDFRAFATPSILQFTSILLIAFTMIIPVFTETGLGVVLSIGGVVGLLAIRRHVIRLFRLALDHQNFKLSEWLAQIIVPTVSYLLVILAGVGFLIDQSYLAFLGACLAVLGLLICGITNTWAMVVWVFEQSRPKP